MKRVYKDSTTEIFETENATVFGIIKDNSKNNYFNVTARRNGEKGKTIATRCTYDKALEIINNF